MNDEPEQSACREIAAYWKRKKENPKTPFADPFASWKQINGCGCGLCMVISAVLRDEDGNRGEAMMEDEDKDRRVTIRFSAAGMMLKMGEKEREVFALQRTCISSTLI